VQHVDEVVREAAGDQDAFVEKLRSVIREHRKLIGAITDARECAPERRRGRLERVGEAVFNHWRQTITRWLAKEEGSPAWLEAKVESILSPWTWRPGAADSRQGEKVGLESV
jgi:hypothetical protein